MVCSAAAKHGHLNILKWLRHHGCQWDSHTSRQAAVNNHLELLRWARQQQPPCPLWSCQERLECRIRDPVGPCMLVYLVQQRAHLHAPHLAKARVAATKMTYAFLSLRAALPDRTPHEVVLGIVNLAFS